MTTHILLTGAGFTANWGGWLAKELEGDLLGRLASHPPLRTLVQESKNYEEALAQARGSSPCRIRISAQELQIFENAITDSFWAMNVALGQRASIFLGGQTRNSILELLSRFDALFTLNQDLLLEFHYQPQRVNHRWNGIYYPGIEPSTPTPLDGREVVRVGRRVGAIGQPDFTHQPIYKLHGSVEWTDGSDTLFVVGGGKEAYIQTKPLLSQYFEIFRQTLLQPNTRLMIIGYGFADQHVNDLIMTSSQNNPSLYVYHVHPEGRDAIEIRSRNQAIKGVSPLRNIPCIGESRRPLSTTFGGDRLEYEKVMRFFQN